MLKYKEPWKFRAYVAGQISKFILISITLGFCIYITLTTSSGVLLLTSLIGIIFGVVGFRQELKASKLSLIYTEDALSCYFETQVYKSLFEESSDLITDLDFAFRRMAYLTKDLKKDYSEDPKFAEFFSNMESEINAINTKYPIKVKGDSKLCPSTFTKECQ